MPDFDLTIDIYVLAVMLALAMTAGFLLRSQQLAKKKRQIQKLEREVEEANAELLEAQKDYCELEKRGKEADSPVIPIKKRQDEAASAGKTESF